MENKFDPYNLIIKYLKKEIADEELSGLNAWLNEDKGNITEFHEIKESWIHSNSLNGDRETGLALNKLNKKIGSVPNQTKKVYIGQWFYRAAAIILLFISSFFLYMYLNENTETQTHSLAVKDLNVIEIPIGEKGQVTLSDGTKIWLNSGTKLSYPSFFSDRREVKLAGEAYFDVAENKQSPFFVKTSDITVKVTGTEFNLKSYPEDETIMTTLVEGAVEILDNSNQNSPNVILKPNEVATFNKNSKIFSLEEGLTKKQQLTEHKIDVQKIQKIEPSVETIISWKENHLVFDNETLYEMTEKMERWFGVYFTLQIEKTNERYSGKFVYNESIEQVLYVLSRTTPIDYKIEKNNVIISSK